MYNNRRLAVLELLVMAHIAASWMDTFFSERNVQIVVYLAIISIYVINVIIEWND